jgi:hypothetical protein
VLKNCVLIVLLFLWQALLRMTPHSQVATRMFLFLHVLYDKRPDDGSFKPKLVAYRVNGRINAWLCMTGYKEYSWLMNRAGMNHVRRGGNYPRQSSAEVKEILELYHLSPLGPSWHVLGRTLSRSERRFEKEAFICEIWALSFSCGVCRMPFFWSTRRREWMIGCRRAGAT